MLKAGPRPNTFSRNGLNRSAARQSKSPRGQEKK